MPSIVSLIFCLFLLILPHSQAWSQTNEQRLAQALSAFNRGNYSEAIRETDQIKTTNTRILSSSLYIKGLSHARLQQFTRASEALTEAARLGNDSSDLFYELGQALYARNSMNEARSAFIRSHQAGHMKAVSLYYLAHISQLLYDNDRAVRYFDELLNEQTADGNLRQIAHFQRAETLLILSEDRPRRERRELARETILPELDLALSLAEEGNAAADIRRRRQEIMDQFNLDPNKMINGRLIPSKRLTLNYSQKLRCDDNITLANDQPTVVTTQRDSYISDSSLYGSYHIPLWRIVSLVPELRLTKIHHLDRTDSTVYTNDRFTVSPGLRNRVEHKLFGRQAAFLIQLLYDKTQQDREATKSLESFSDTWTYGLGYRIRALPWGDTTIRYRFKTYRAFNNNLDNDTHTFSLDQSFLLPNRHLAVLLLQYDDVDNFRNPLTSSSTFMTRLDYIMTNIVPRTNLYLGLSYMGITTDRQPERGTEVTWSPSVRLTRRISPNFRIGIDYNYSQKSSNLVSNEYVKNTTSLELRYDY